MAVACMCANCGFIGATRSGSDDKIKCPLYCKDCDTDEKRAKQKESLAELKTNK